MGNILDDLDGIPGANRLKNWKPSAGAGNGTNNSGANIADVKPVSNLNAAQKKSTSVQNDNKPVAYLRGVSGEYQNKRIIIRDGDTYTFGRSPKNHIVFSENKRGVSRLHLFIQSVASEKKVILVDVDSSYGTYDAVKRRFVSNYPYELHEGDVFTFGYDQMFKVEFE